MLLLSVALGIVALLPLVIVLIFSGWQQDRKQENVFADFQKLNAFSLPLLSNKGGAGFIQKEISNLFSVRELAEPAFLLCCLYVPGTVLCNSSLYLLGGKSPWPFPQQFVLLARPVIFAFIGVYLFNFGTMVRRLYVSDLTKNVFWGGINRLLLSIGLAIVVASGIAVFGGSTAGHGWDLVFFVIGFVTNAVLKLVIKKANDVGNLGLPKTVDLPLQMVSGINIWNEYRLEEEGIENIQNLATADVVDLAVHTHYELRTLIDWIDQAILINRLREDQIKQLLQIGAPISAIDMAWNSPENSGETEIADLIADELKFPKPIWRGVMDSLYEDAYVRALWTMWQTTTEAPRKKAVGAK